MATVPLIYTDVIDASSGPNKQGFAINTVQYSGKISQVTFNGPTQESSREEVWTVKWKGLIYDEANPTATSSTYYTMKQFFESNYLGLITWQPFELQQDRVWKIKANSWKQKNRAGCVFDVSFQLVYLYNV